MRWWAGFVIPNDDALKQKLAAAGLQILELPSSRVVSATFPWKSMLSPMFGPLYVLRPGAADNAYRWTYPLIEEYILNRPELKMNAAVELYSERARIITYLIYQNWSPEWQES